MINTIISQLITATLAGCVFWIVVRQVCKEKTEIEKLEKICLSIGKTLGRVHKAYNLSVSYPNLSMEEASDIFLEQWSKLNEDFITLILLLMLI